MSDWIEIPGKEHVDDYVRTWVSMIEDEYNEFVRKMQRAEAACAAMRAAIQLRHDFMDLDTKTFVDKYGPNITSGDVRRREEAALVNDIGEDIQRIVFAAYAFAAASRGLYDRDVENHWRYDPVCADRAWRRLWDALVKVFPDLNT